MHRRDVVAAVGALATSALAGCADEEPDGPVADDADPTEDDADDDADSPEAVEAFHNAITVIDDELGVEASGVESAFVWVDFYTSGELLEDLQVVGGAYAGAVDQGLDRTLDAIAVQEDAPVEEYVVTVEPEWAQQFVDEEISGQEYLERIEETLE
ncbi:hypothetical protein JCM18237_02270 [Halorubrum luteum]